MSRATAMRMMRKFEVVGGTLEDVEGKETITPAQVQKRKDTIPAIPREQRECQICGKSMMVSYGQVAKFHKECRKERHHRSMVLRAPKLGDPMQV